MKLTILMLSLLLLPTCRSTEDKPQLYRSVVPGLTVGETAISGIYKEVDVAAPKISNREKVGNTIVDFLLYGSGIVAAISTALLAAAVYFKSESLGISGGAGYVLALVMCAAAYWFTYIMWIVGGVFLLALGIIVFLAINMFKDKKVITELVDTGQVMKDAEKWTDELRVELLHKQSHRTQKAVVKAKAKLDKLMHKDYVRETLRKIIH